MTLEILHKMNWNNILILGNGFVGNHLYNHLSLSPTVKSVVIKGSSELDYHNPKILYKYLFNNDITTVINCSGFTGVPNIDEAEHKKELCWKLNVNSPLKVNELCHKLGVSYVHVSSGCIFDGYHKDWTEDDTPNYGMFSNNSSFYSKTKHVFEMMSKDLYGVVLRVRMPFDSSSSRRNYLTKIRSYDNLINYRNSKTYIPDFCEFVEKLLEQKTGFWASRETYNVVNPEPLDTKEICKIMEGYGLHNSQWKFVPIEDLKIVAGRSNCVLDAMKVEKIHKMKTETEAIIDATEKLLKLKV